MVEDNVRYVNRRLL